MRLLGLYLGDYRVLHDLRIEFDHLGRTKPANRSYNLDFLVGVNGSGKSTVLRALMDIFQSLSGEKQDIKFPFAIEYWLEEKNIRIAATNIHPETDALLDGFLVFRSNDLTGEKPAFELHTLTNVLTVEELPSRVIAYTTGAEEDWQVGDANSRFDASDSTILETFPQEDLALRELPARQQSPVSTGKPISTFIRLIPKDELSIVALCGMLVNAADPNEQNFPLKHVFSEAKIQGISGFSLQFDISAATFQQRQEIYNRLATHAIRKNRNGGEVRLVFNLADFAPQVKDEFGSGLELYEFLSGLAIRSAQQHPVLSGISLFIERQPENGKTPPLHTWNWLSDGERSFLGRMCLFLLFGDTDALIMLDEPEVHFNDYWKRHIVGLLHNILIQKEVARQNMCHLLIATHSSIALTDVHRDDIILLVRKNLHTSGESQMPSFQTFGADPSDIMVHVFGTKFASGDHSVSYIREQIGKSNKEELEKLQKEVAPGYWSYRIQLEIDQFGEVRAQ